ncbi:hypothetical protein UA08_08640 [Talaromyces atroroseus]|uniref:Uncharacterized protein n=1 Tax=Talaromyces atroroseus TaxID=1441469 RepID=A0A225ADJ7_TALAT|nr:hypothetical protein UA08_08640 [Talaromyces atroroseus]OKL56014.1 hypothetical protein UA08_08640 [Talaromyces atroroseus]
MHVLHQTAASSLSLPSGSYIYAIAAAPSHFAAISSDDSLRLFDGQSLQPLAITSAKAHDGVTALKEFHGSTTDTYLLATAGRDGAVRLWDVRSGQHSKPAVEMRVEKHAPILSLSCDPDSHSVVAGTELVSSQATVALWDIRAPAQKRLQYVESHNDDVTELQFHPTRKNVLLSGSTDGLVNLYDINVADEDDALLQVVNHGSIHHAGFLSETAIYALSHDETFSIHPITNPDSEEQNEYSPIKYGDLRPLLGCEYVVQTLTSDNGQGSYLAAGNTTNVWRLPGAHGEEIVRAVHIDDQSRTVFTGGEDGFIRAWRQPESEEMQDPSFEKTNTRTKERKKYKDEKRFKPY